MPTRLIGVRTAENQFATEERPVASGVTVSDGDLVGIAAGGAVTNATLSAVKLYGCVQGGPNTDLVSRNYRTPKTLGVADGSVKVLVAMAKDMQFEIPVNGSLASDAEGSYYKLVPKSQVLLTSNATAPANNDTVTIGGVVYTYKTTLTGAANEVLIGASASIALDNLKSAINATAGAGTTYGTGTVVNPVVAATTKTATTLVFEAVDQTADGTALAATDTSANLAFDQAYLSGGTGRQIVDNLTKSATVGQLLCLRRIATNAAGTVFAKGVFIVAALSTETTVT